MIYRARFWRDNRQVHEVEFACTSTLPGAVDEALEAAIAGHSIKQHDIITIAPKD